MFMYTHTHLATYIHRFGSGVCVAPLICHYCAFPTVPECSDGTVDALVVIAYVVVVNVLCASRTQSVRTGAKESRSAHARNTNAARSILRVVRPQLATFCWCSECIVQFAIALQKK